MRAQRFNVTTPLKNMLETVAFEGLATLAKWKITRWYGQSNFTVSIRRDVRQRWDALHREELEIDKTPILRMADVDGKIVFMKKADFFPDKE
jgi:hypothetical protein